MSLVPLRRNAHSSAKHLTAFLPTTREEMAARGWDEIDILLVNGDAYVDHPAFGAALIGRFLEGRGFRVGMIAQPRWNTPDDLRRLGRPRLMVGITAGNLDSMLNKLTAQKKVRGEDQYSPGGRTNLRPNRASIVYANLCRQALPGVPRRPWRNRGLAPPHRSLRLLVRLRAPLGDPGRQGRPADLRHGRAPRLGGRRAAP